MCHNGSLLLGKKVERMAIHPLLDIHSDLPTWERKTPNTNLHICFSLNNLIIKANLEEFYVLNTLVVHPSLV